MLMESADLFLPESQRDHRGAAPRLPDPRSVVNKQHNGLVNGTQRQTPGAPAASHWFPLLYWPECCSSTRGSEEAHVCLAPPAETDGSH